MAPSTVLIVEDEVDIREALAELLQDEGFDVAAVANGQEALQRLRVAPHPKVIVMDLMMPVMNGWELLQTLEADATLRGIPTVVTSAALDVNLPEGILVIKKPVRFDELLAHIRAALPTPSVDILADSSQRLDAAPTGPVLSATPAEAKAILEPAAGVAEALAAPGVQEPPEAV